MPRGKKVVTPLFGIIAISLSLYFLPSENKALASQKPYVVVIDPGHGGADHGASGRLGQKKIDEKDVALAIARKTEKFLNDPTYSRPLGRRIKVILTRRSDKAVSLEERSEKAQKARADLFVSIHANSETTHKARGLETYFLNNTDDESSRKLERIENKASKRAHREDSLILRSVAADAVVESSRSAAELLQSSIAEELHREDVRFQDRGVKQAMLYVLLDSQVPAALVECFYVSNAQDLALVSQPENRARIAEGLAKGILRFLATR